MWNSDRKIQPGIAWKDGKFYEFKATRITVLRLWGKNAGCWIKEKSGKGWIHGWPSNLYLPSLFASELTEPTIHSCFAHMIPQVIQSTSIEEFRNARKSLFPDPEDILNSEEDKLLFRTYMAQKLYCLKMAEVQKYIMENIPAGVLEEVYQYPYKKWWGMLQLFNRVPEALKISRKNKGLAFMLSSVSSLLPQKANRMRFLRSLVKKPEKEILQAFGFPGENWILRLLQRMNPESFRVKLLKRLRSDSSSDIAIGRIKIRHWQHFSRLARYSISWRAISAGLSPALCINAFQYDEQYVDCLKEILVLVKDVKQMVEQIPEEAVPDFSNVYSLERVKKIHDQIQTKHIEYQKHLLEEQPEYPEFSGQLPPGTEHIKTPGELVAEGLELNHCISSYNPQIHNGTYLALRMKYPERCSIGIAVNEKLWQLDQIKGYNNRAVQQSTKKIILNWLNCQNLIENNL